MSESPSGCTYDSMSGAQSPVNVSTPQLHSQSGQLTPRESSSIGVAVLRTNSQPHNNATQQSSSQTQQGSSSSQKQNASGRDSQLSQQPNQQQQSSSMNSGNNQAQSQNPQARASSGVAAQQQKTNNNQSSQSNGTPAHPTLKATQSRTNTVCGLFFKILRR